MLLEDVTPSLPRDLQTLAKCRLGRRVREATGSAAPGQEGALCVLGREEGREGQRVGSRKRPWRNGLMGGLRIWICSLRLRRWAQVSVGL